MSHLNDEILLTKIAERIKKLRLQRGVSLEQFHDDTDINLAKIESRKANISLTTLQEICKYFGVTISELMKGV
jgi:transcriptional regulator with XRE-family HTH domain